MISIVCYLWEGPRAFAPEYVDALARMVGHHLPEPHRFICVTDRSPSCFSKAVEVMELPRVARDLIRYGSPEGPKFPCSYPRLWTFSAEACALGERVLLLDIDCMVVSDLRRLLAPQADFVGWRVRSLPGHPPRMGGGTWLLRTGTRTHVWERFISDPKSAIREARNAGYRGSDQAWISFCLSATEPCWEEPSGVYCAQDYRKQLRGKRRVPLPSSRIVVPPDAIILHMNGNVMSKPWNVRDQITDTHWRPFAQC